MRNQVAEFVINIQSNIETDGQPIIFSKK